MNLILLYVFPGGFSSEFHHNFPTIGRVSSQEGLEMAYLTEHGVELLVFWTKFRDDTDFVYISCNTSSMRAWMPGALARID